MNFTRIDSERLNPELVPAQTVVFNDERTFDEFWAKYGSPPTPAVGFDEHVVAGIFLGARPNPGHGLEVDRILRTNDNVSIHSVEYLPDPDAAYIQIVVYPYELVSIPRPPGTITFISEQRLR